MCVAGGVVAPEPLKSRHTCTQFQGNHALLKSLVGAPRRRRIIGCSSCVFFLMCFVASLCDHLTCSARRSAGIYLPCSPCRSAGIYLTCSSRRSAGIYLTSSSRRHLPSLLIPPFRWHQPSLLIPPLRRHQPDLLILPFPAGPDLSYTSCVNKLCLSFVKSCFRLCFGVRT